MKKKALRSNRNRHTVKVNAYKQSIIDHKDSVLTDGYATLTTQKRTIVNNKPVFCTVDQTVSI